jgi:glutamine synthetase
MAPNYGITNNDENVTLLSSTSTDEPVQRTLKSAAATKQQQLSISIPYPSEFKRNFSQGSQAAIIRSLRAAGVKFIRFATVDAYNTIRCKTVPLAHLSSQRRTTQTSHPLNNPVSIAEICFAGLPSSADVPAAPNLSSRNVLTLQPDFSSLRILPYASKTAMVMCTAHDQQSQDLSPLCTRGLLQRVLHSAREDLGIEFSVGAELEFQLYREDKDGVMQPVDVSTFGNATTLNKQEDFISTLYDQLEQQDIPIELIHSESAPGQLEVVLSYSDDILQLADDVVYARETVTNVAKQHGLKALFLPKTSMMTAGNGSHLHFSFREVGSQHRNAFSDPSQTTGISRKGEAFIEGLLDHLPSLLSLSIPTVNSFRRVGPGCWTGHKLGWSTEDKDSPVRVCIDLNTQQASNVELKLSDATANIYLELAAVLAAGMEGIKDEKELRPMMNDESNALPLPHSLQESLDSLKKDELLLSILGDELSTAYIAVRELEARTETSLEEEVSAALDRA